MTVATKKGVWKDTSKIFIKHALRYPYKLAFVLVVMPITSIIMSIVIPFVFSRVIANLAAFASGDVGVESDIYQMLWFIAGLLLVELIGWRVVDFTLIKHQIKVLRDLEQTVFDSLLQHSYSFHVNNFGGSLVAQGKRFVNAYEHIFDLLFFDFTGLFIRVVFSTVVLTWQSPTIGLMFLLWVIFFVSVQVWLIRKKSPYTKVAAAADSSVTANLADAVTNIMNIKIFGRETFEEKRFRGTINDRMNKRHKSWMLDWRIRFIQHGMSIGLYLSSIVVSSLLLINGSIDIGTVILLQLYMLPLFSQLWNFGRQMQRMEQSFSDASEMTQILTSEPSVQDVNKAKKIQVDEGNIEFKNMSFKYEDSNSQNLFKNFNLDITPKTHVGLVGPSGGGKSTITMLLLRFIDINSGEILIDGHDVSKVKQSALREAIAYVPQEPILFHRSILENIRYGKPSATEKQVLAAARKANAHRFIKKLPQGYNTLVGERGTKLSGGEKQRVAIARAMLKDAPILVLDEATSALDSESEQLIQDALGKLMSGRTTIVIAHRLSTIQRSDRIVVLSDGKIVEDGSHKELVEHGGLYAELWSHQSGGFIES